MACDSLPKSKYIYKHVRSYFPPPQFVFFSNSSVKGKESVGMLGKVWRGAHREEMGVEGKKEGPGDLNVSLFTKAGQWPGPTFIPFIFCSYWIL